jgi:signal transduction histidine kinase
MLFPEVGKDEAARLAALKEYSILDTLEEIDFDEVTFLAAQICKTPISLITLVDEKRQWFKSHYGIEIRETPRDISFCAHTINLKSEKIIVNDATKDERFWDNPLVTNAPKVIFYVGFPLVDSDGFALGTLCVIDHKVNSLDEIQLNTMQTLANHLMRMLETRKNSISLQNKLAEIQAQYMGLDQFAHTVAHDISSPLHNISGLIEILRNDYADKLDGYGQNVVKYINSSANKLIDLIQGILKHSKMTKILSETKNDFNVLKTVKEVTDLLDANQSIKFKFYIDPDLEAFTNKTALEQILINLISNGIKYNDKPEVFISISVKKNKDLLVFNVIDNGIGIAENEKENAFKIFETTSNTDKFGKKGNGIGLATVLALVKGLGGEIALFSEKGVGCNFEFTIKNL